MVDFLKWIIKCPLIVMDSEIGTRFSTTTSIKRHRERCSFEDLFTGKIAGKGSPSTTCANTVDGSEILHRLTCMKLCAFIGWIFTIVTISTGTGFLPSIECLKLFKKLVAFHDGFHDSMIHVE